MPRKTLIRSKELPYHVTARCNNREAFFCDLDQIWAILFSELNETIEIYQIKIHALVLMPNHFHLLISTPGADLGVVMQTFIREVTIKINLKAGRTGRVFGSRYHWSLIDSTHYYDCALKYVYRNPVKSGLSAAVEEYEFSTLMDVIEEARPFITIEPPIGYQSNIPQNRKNEFLNWLNQPFRNEHEEAIKKAFRKTKFLPPQVRGNRVPMALEGFNG